MNVKVNVWRRKGTHLLWVILFFTDISVIFFKTCIYSNLYCWYDIKSIYIEYIRVQKMWSTKIITKKLFVLQILTLLMTSSDFVGIHDCPYWLINSRWCRLLCASCGVITYFHMQLTPLKWVLAMADSAGKNH